jgi:nitrogen regulatory protein PII-like uncharacterized protein
MFNFFKRKNTPEVTTVVEQGITGRFRIVEYTGTTPTAIHGTYTRKRDAIRGAQRKGITLANA